MLTARERKGLALLATVADMNATDFRKGLALTNGQFRGVLGYMTGKGHVVLNGRRVAITDKGRAAI